MFGAISPAGSPAAPDTGVLNGRTPARDDESRLVATLRRTNGGADGQAPPRRGAAARARRVANEIMRAIEARLPGRVRDLKVDFENDAFTLRGLSTSYYVKQIAGHLAMNALDAHLLGRLNNEIEVRATR